MIGFFGGLVGIAVIVLGTLIGGFIPLAFLGVVVLILSMNYTIKYE